MTDHEVTTDARSVALTLGVAGACWVAATAQMRGMDMGVATTLGPFGFFTGIWALMMAAMMLPGAAPAVARYTQTQRRLLPTVGFVGAYTSVWMIVGIAAYVIYRPHGTVIAGVVTVIAGVYELTPLKRHARLRCQQRVETGYHLGVYCVGSSIGLMAMLLAIGAMSIAWMSVITAVVLVQKLCPPRKATDLPLAMAISAFGALILLVPASIPGLLPSM